MDADVETVTLLWDAAPSNGAAISSYTVTVLLDSQQVYTGMSVDTSLSVTRNDFQDQEDTRRDTEYQVTVSAVNSVGSGDEVTETLTIPSGMISLSENVCTHTEHLWLLIECFKQNNVALLILRSSRDGE